MKFFKRINIIIFFSLIYLCFNQKIIINDNINLNKTKNIFNQKILFTNILLSNYASSLYIKISNYKISSLKEKNIEKIDIKNSGLFSSIKNSMIINLTKAIFKNYHLIKKKNKLFIKKLFLSFFIAFLINTNLYLLRNNPKLRDIIRFSIVFYSNISCYFDYKSKDVIDAYFFIIKQVITFLSYFPIKFFVNKLMKNKIINSILYAIICSICELKIISLIYSIKNIYFK